jgi:hypothetical protein
MGLTVDVDLAEAKKYRCSTIPLRRHGSFHLLKDDGVGRW